MQILSIFDLQCIHYNQQTEGLLIGNQIKTHTGKGMQNVVSYY